MTTWKVPYVDLPARYRALQPKIDDMLHGVFASGRFIGGEMVERFEQEMAEYLGVKHVVGVGSGYDALYLALRALGIGPGDEVITVSHTFVATIAAIRAVGATPILVDVTDTGLMDVTLIEDAITPKTRAILPVHLNGAMCEMKRIIDIARKHNLEVVEDAAQAIGASLIGKMAGAWGNAGCFSLHPLKTLSVAGDGGFIATDSKWTADEARRFARHGYQDGRLTDYGINSRLDAIQAGIALLQLKTLDQQIERRRKLVRGYNRYFDHRLIGGCAESPSSYVIQTTDRDALQSHLTDKGIETFIHWPIPLHKHSALGLHLCRPLPITEALAERVLSLPIYPEMTDGQQQYVINSVREFYGG